MVAGMMPTALKAGFVSAVLEVGYHIELAGGGHYSLAALHAKVAREDFPRHQFNLTLYQFVPALLLALTMARYAL